MLVIISFVPDNFTNGKKILKLKNTIPVREEAVPETIYVHTCV